MQVRRSNTLPVFLHSCYKQDSCGSKEAPKLAVVRRGTADACHRWSKMCSLVCILYCGRYVQSAAPWPVVVRHHVVSWHTFCVSRNAERMNGKGKEEYEWKYKRTQACPTVSTQSCSRKGGETNYKEFISTDVSPQIVPLFYSFLPSLVWDVRSGMKLP